MQQTPCEGIPGLIFPSDGFSRLASPLRVRNHIKLGCFRVLAPPTGLCSTGGLAGSSSGWFSSHWSLWLCWLERGASRHQGGSAGCAHTPPESGSRAWNRETLKWTRSLRIPICDNTTSVHLSNAYSNCPLFAVMSLTNVFALDRGDRARASTSCPPERARSSAHCVNRVDKNLQ